MVRDSREKARKAHHAGRCSPKISTGDSHRPAHGHSLQREKHLVPPPPDWLERGDRQARQEDPARDPTERLVRAQLVVLARRDEWLEPERAVQRCAQPDEAAYPAVCEVELFVAEAEGETEGVILDREEDERGELREGEEAWEGARRERCDGRKRAGAARGSPARFPFCESSESMPMHTPTSAA